MSLEVGEHIPKASEQDLLDNVAGTASRGVVLSWAIIGQGGHGHVNCQNNEHIIHELSVRGFSYNATASARLREAVTKARWFTNTLMVFEK